MPRSGTRDDINGRAVGACGVVGLAVGLYYQSGLAGGLAFGALIAVLAALRIIR
jgi:hypothetical protein